MRVQLAAFWGSHDPSPLNKTRYSAFVEVVFSSSPLFCSPLPPNPPPQGKPPGERATPARRPAASKLKKDLNFQDRISGAVSECTRPYLSAAAARAKRTFCVGT